MGIVIINYKSQNYIAFSNRLYCVPISTFIQVTTSAFETLVTYMYVGAVDIETESIEDIKYLAKQFNLDCLLEEMDKACQKLEKLGRNLFIINYIKYYVADRVFLKTDSLFFRKTCNINLSL